MIRGKVKVLCTFLRANGLVISKMGNRMEKESTTMVREINLREPINRES